MKSANEIIKEMDKEIQENYSEYIEEDAFVHWVFNLDTRDILEYMLEQENCNLCITDDREIDVIPFQMEKDNQIYNIELEYYDFKELNENQEDYKEWLEDCFRSPIEVEDGNTHYTLEINII